MSLRTLTAAAVLAAGAVGSTVFAVAQPASADPGAHANSERRHVCAVDVYVRDKPSGVVIGTLYQGETFDYEYTDGSYQYGMAYGNVNKHGWVITGSTSAGC